MPAGMSFMQLEGNYIISFRDMNEALPAFTAVKLDRRRGSLDTSISASNLTVGPEMGGPRRGSLSVFGGDGPRRGSISVFGSDGPRRGSISVLGSDSPRRGSTGSALNEDINALAAAAAAARRRSSALATPHKLLLTGVPRSVREDVLRSRLETVIPGIERVYRDEDMARNLSRPPVFVETKSSLALDAFMLRADWVPLVDRLIKQANEPAASEDEGIGSSFSATVSGPLSSKEYDEEDQNRRQSLVDTLVTCPHGRYNGRATCPICRAGGRRNSMLSDDIVGHNVVEAGGSAPDLRPRPVPVTGPARRSPPPPPAKKSCPSCMACLRRLVPGKRRPPLQDDDDDQQPQQASPSKDTSLLDLKFLASIKTQRSKSIYDDVPAVKVDEVDRL